MHTDNSSTSTLDFARGFDTAVGDPTFVASTTITVEVQVLPYRLFRVEADGDVVRGGFNTAEAACAYAEGIEAAAVFPYRLWKVELDGREIASGFDSAEAACDFASMACGPR